MSKASDLSLVLDELKQCGETMIGISDSLREIFSTPAPVEEPEPEKSKEKEKPKAKKEDPKPISFEELRAVMARKTSVSKVNTDAIRELLLQHGANKLSEVKPEEYATLLKEAEVIPDA
jgi:hypothetical protein